MKYQVSLPLACDTLFSPTASAAEINLFKSYFLKKILQFISKLFFKKQKNLVGIGHNWFVVTLTLLKSPPSSTKAMFKHNNFVIFKPV